MKNTTDTNSKISCRLLYSCDFGISEDLLLRTPRYKHDNYWTEEYNNFNFLIDRIHFTYLLLSQAYIKNNVDIFSEECSWHELTIDTENYGTKTLGLSPYGWNISIYFFYYLRKYFERHYGKENIYEIVKEKAGQEEVWFYLNFQTEPNIFLARESVSEETALIILKNFLDGKDERDIDPNIFYQEIEKRNYLE